MLGAGREGSAESSPALRPPRAGSSASQESRLMKTEFRAQACPRACEAKSQPRIKALESRCSFGVTARVSLDPDLRTPACPSRCLSGSIKVERQPEATPNPLSSRLQRGEGAGKGERGLLQPPPT